MCRVWDSCTTVCAVTYYIFVNEQRNLYLFCCLQQGFTNPGHQVAVAITFFMVVPNICGSAVWKLLHVTVLMPGIWRWLLHFKSFVHPWLSLNLWQLKNSKDNINKFCVPHNRLTPVL
jgi:hypothetical protein